MPGVLNMNQTLNTHNVHTSNDKHITIQNQTKPNQRKGKTSLTRTLHTTRAEKGKPDAAKEMCPRFLFY